MRRKTMGILSDETERLIQEYGHIGSVASCINVPHWLMNRVQQEIKESKENDNE
jgi:hypothetical protein